MVCVFDIMNNRTDREKKDEKKVTSNRNIVNCPDGQLDQEDCLPNCPVTFPRQSGSPWCQAFIITSPTFFPPVFSHWLPTWCRFSTFRPVKAKVAPSLEKSTAVAAPIPELAPVTSALITNMHLSLMHAGDKKKQQPTNRNHYWSSLFTSIPSSSSVINPLTARVIGAPQMILQPVFSIFLFSTALWDLPDSRPVHSLMLSSYLYLCPPCLLPPFTVPCKMVLARPDERETWPYHCSLRLFMIIRSSCGPIACWNLARTSSLVTWSLYEMCSILW